MNSKRLMSWTSQLIDLCYEIARNKMDTNEVYEKINLILDGETDVQNNTKSIQ